MKKAESLPHMGGRETDNNKTSYNLPNFAIPVRTASLKENKGKVELLSTLVIKQTTVLATSLIC